MNRTINRKEFLSMLGISAAAIAGTSCLGGCKGEDNVVAPPANVDFTLDLTAAANAALNANGGFVYRNGVIVARTTSGAYVAVSSTCTHAGGTVFYQTSNDRFHCPNHGSEYSTAGSVLLGPAERSLARYNTSLDGTSLRVFS